MRLALLLSVSLLAPPAAPASSASAAESAVPAPYLIVLGIAQDGGAPQAGYPAEPGWHDPAKRRLATSLAVVDPASGGRWLFDATPDFPEQLQRLDEIAPHTGSRPGLSGIFLTHAHIGHYAGLMYLGKEVIGAKDLPVYAMPRMSQFLTDNGPWQQLVRIDNIVLKPLSAGEPVPLTAGLRVTPILVPHRQEYSEVVGYRIEGANASVLFIPDIDSWTQWDALGTRIEDEIARVDVAYLDGTFFANGEIPGRDMSGFPHPFISASLARFAALPTKERAKIRYIHLNHTNAALWPESAERGLVNQSGSRIAEEGERVELGAD
ncbi:MAG: MBL fold metallo-hydrolase [Arenimonas sp.]|nr:MBL fold metallo-hydrolase [Arenimonas sp.]